MTWAGEHLPPGGWQYAAVVPTPVTCPWCARSVEGDRGPLPRHLGDYVHTCGATFRITDDGVDLIEPGHPDYRAAYSDAAPASLRERLRDALSGVVRPAAVTYEAEQIEAVVIGWLRDQQRDESGDQYDRRIRDLADEAERGEV